MGVIVGDPVVASQPSMAGPFTRWIGGCRLMAAFNNVGVPQSIGDVSLILPKAGTADWGEAASGPYSTSRGVQIDADTEAFQASTPSWLRMSWPITMIMGVAEVGTPEASCSHFGTVLQASPFVSWMFVGAGSGDLTRIGVAVSSGATFTDLRATLITAPLTAGRHYILGVSLRPGVQEMYQDGVLLAATASGFVGGDATYTNALTTFGDGVVSATRNSQSIYTFGYIFSGYGGPGLHRSIADNPWQVFEPELPQSIYYPDAAPGAFLAAWASQRSRVIGAGVH